MAKTFEADRLERSKAVAWMLSPFAALGGVIAVSAAIYGVHHDSAKPAAHIEVIDPSVAHQLTCLDGQTLRINLQHGQQELVHVGHCTQSQLAEAP
jgi:hypothetical protein